MKALKLSLRGKFMQGPNLQRLLFALTLGLLSSHAEQAPSRLQYTTPETWNRVVDPSTKLVSVVPPGGKVAVTFSASQEFAGTAEEWREAMWDSLLKDKKLAKPAESGKQGEFLCRTGAFTKPDGSQPWICLYTLVKNGHGEGIIFFATDEQHFLTHVDTVNRMVRGITVGDTLNPPKDHAPPAKERPPGDGKTVSEAAAPGDAAARLGPIALPPS